jgi:signal transduction histidine kinase
MNGLPATFMKNKNHITLLLLFLLINGFCSIGRALNQVPSPVQLRVGLVNKGVKEIVTVAGLRPANTLMIDTLRRGMQRSQYTRSRMDNEVQEQAWLLNSNEKVSQVTHKERKDQPIDPALEQTIRQLQKQVQIAEQKGLKLDTEEAYHRLAEAYARKGDYQRAYQYEQIRFAKHDSLLLRSLSNSKLLTGSTYPPVPGSVNQRQNNNLLWSYLLFSSGMVCLFLALMLYRNSNRTRNINQQLREQNQEIRRQQEMLVAQRDSIEEKSRKMEMLNSTKDKFFSIVAHDLKGPLNSLSSFSNLLANDLHLMSPQEIKIIAQELNKSVKNTSRLTENLLTWARMQMNSLQHYPVAVDLNKILEENLALFHSTARQKNILLDIHSIPDIRVCADESQLRFVLRNLTANALKFTRPEGTIQIITQHEKDQVIISVVDNGVGISEEIIEKIFRIDAKHSTIGTAGEKGTGLGLVLCKEFVEKNGGRIEVTSESGKGSTFSVYLQKAGEAA